MYLLASKFRFLEFRLLLSRVAPFTVRDHELFDKQQRDIKLYKKKTSNETKASREEKLKQRGYFACIQTRRPQHKIKN